MLKKENQGALEGCVADMGEQELITRFIEPHTSGIGDDCAWVRPQPGQGLLISSDALIEDVHFLRSSPAAWVGQKALRVNASDIAASGGRPQWATLALSLPGNLPLAWLQDFVSGFAAALKSYGVAWIGGDVTASPKHIAMTVTIFGQTDAPAAASLGPLTRAGAQPGDLVAVTGFLGETLPGLDSLLGRRALAEQQRQVWEKRHFHPPNRVAFAAACHARGLITSLMDLSDGLKVDARRLAKASSVKLHLHLERVPLTKNFQELGYNVRDAVLAGEDYELLMTVPPEFQKPLLELAENNAVPLHVIGQVFAGTEVVFFQAQEPIIFHKKPWHHF